MNSETIFAPATGAGRAAISIIRLSGPQAFAVLRGLTGRERWTPRRATRAPLRAADGELLDDALVLWFPAPGSFTGEDMAELHLHGSRAVVSGVLADLSRRPGLRPAEPGEFARRAFRCGKLDLTRIEALADLVAAETAAQRRQALRQWGGALAALYDGWREQLLRSMALIEAGIDFSDEELPGGLEAQARAEAAQVRAAIARHLDDAGCGERLRDGFSVVLLGAPNAGKSSLLNALARREAAIVDAAPGTTRDVIEVALDLDGLPVLLADTAGLREAAGPVEQEGVRRSHARAADADLRLAVFDGARWPEQDAETLRLLDDRTLAVISKQDLGRVAAATHLGDWPALLVSAHTGEGMGALLAAVRGRIAGCWQQDGAPGGVLGDGPGGQPALTRARHRVHLERACAALDRFATTAATETAAEELRAAAAALGRITGRIDVEDVLDRIFGEFCIGK